MEILYLLVGVTTTKVYSIQMCALELSCSIFFDDDFRWGTLRGRKSFHRNYVIIGVQTTTCKAWTGVLYE